MIEKLSSEARTMLNDFLNQIDYEKEIANLNNDATRLNEIVKEKQQEIEKLNKGIEALIFMSNKTKETRDKEIERLNNIINELEKYCNEEIKDYDEKIDFYKANKLNDEFRKNYEGEKVCFEDMLEKIKELKGSDKE